MPKTKAITALPPTFTMRPARMEDLKPTADLLAAAGEALVGHPEITVEAMGVEWETPGFDLENSTRLVFNAGAEPVGYAEVWDLQATPVTPFVWARVHPDYEGRGIGAALIAWAEERARQVFDRVPADARVALHCSTLSDHQPSLDLFRERGMTPVRYFWRMEIELDAAPPFPPFPDGLTVRTMEDVNDLRAVYRTVDAAFQDHWGHVPRSEEEDLRRWEHETANDPDYDPSLWFLAMDGEEIAGVALCRHHRSGEPEMGWVNMLGVKRPYRRRGLGLALLRHAFAVLYRRGQRQVGLGVDADSLTGATGLYEKAGMHVARQRVAYEKELRPGRDLTKQEL